MLTEIPNIVRVFGKIQTNLKSEALSLSRLQLCWYWQEYLEESWRADETCSYSDTSENQQLWLVWNSWNEYNNNNRKKQLNEGIKMILILVDAIGTVLMSLEMGLQEFEIRGKIDSIQTT